jgi:hypothetical protein
MGQTAAGIFNPNVADPRQAQWGDLDGSEKTSRLLAGGLKGAGLGIARMGQQQPPMGGGGEMQVPMPQQQQVQLPGMDPQKKNNLAFFGGQ